MSEKFSQCMSMEKSALCQEMFSRKYGYEEESGKKAIQSLVPNKYKLRFGDVNPSLNQGEDIFPQHKHTVLLKEPGFSNIICKRDEAESIMEWAVETLLPREVRKLVSAIEEEDAAIALLNNDLQNREYENVY